MTHEVANMLSEQTDLGPAELLSSQLHVLLLFCTVIFSVFQIYQQPNYKADLIVASTALVISALVVFITFILVSYQQKDKIDHL